MNICPHCKGEKWLISHSNGSISPVKALKCWTCNGEGTVSNLKLAIWKARGGPAPIQTRGF